MTKETRNQNDEGSGRATHWCFGLRHSFVILISSFVISTLVACGESGPPMYELTGVVKYDGTLLPVGHIRFEPQEGVRTKDTVTQSLIKNGRYELKVTGGPHRVMIRDMAGEYDLPEVQNARSLFAKEYREDIELPTPESIDQEPVTKDFEIPATHR